MIQLDGRLMKSLRDKRHWTQNQLATKAGVCVRTISDIEVNERPVTPFTASLLAQALGVNPELLTAKYFYNAPYPWQELPLLPDDLRKLFLRTMEEDMLGQHLEAAAHCTEILEKLPDGLFTSPLAVRVKRAVYLDNGGAHKEAMRELTEALRILGANRDKTSRYLEHVTHWIQYHMGVCYRRLDLYAEAERELRQLLACPEDRYRIAAEHQLGVLYFRRARNLEPDMIERARASFESTLDAWRRCGCFRQAFSCRRLGQLLAWLGAYNDAIEAFYEAGAIFARHYCTRYVAETKGDLRRYVLAKLPPHAGGNI